MSKDLREFCETAFIAFVLIALAATIAQWTNYSKNAEAVFQISFALALLFNVIHSKIKAFQYLGLWFVLFSAAIVSSFADGYIDFAASIAGCIASMLMLYFSRTNYKSNRIR